MNKSNSNQLTAITVVAVVSIIAVTVLLIFAPSNDSVTLLLGFAALMVTNIIQGKSVSDGVADVHKLINSRMTELLNVSTTAAKAEGVIEGEANKKKVST